MILDLQGIMDRPGGRQVLDRISNLIDSGNSNILLNFLETEAVEGAGLRTLWAAHRRVRSAGGRLVLCSLNRAVRTSLEITGLEAVFNICPDETAALDEF